MAGPRLVHVAPAPQMFWVVFRGPIARSRAAGFDVHAVSSPGEHLAPFAAREGIPVHVVPISRQVSPLADLVAIARLALLLRRLRPEIVVAHTTKGGLVGMAAAWLAGVPVRVYQNRGMALCGARGLTRALLAASERAAGLLAHRVLTIAPSLARYAAEHRLWPREKIRSIRSGSSNGVDATGRFSPGPFPEARRRAARRALGIPERAPVVLFAGRVHRPKGVEPLLDAFLALRDAVPDLHLVCAGWFEERDPVSPAHEALLREHPRIRWLGWVEDMVDLHLAADVVALPSFNEGFGNVLLEAAAAGRPAIASRVVGAQDAVVDGVTGTLVPPGDAVALAAAIRRYAEDPALRARHGRAGRARALADFRPRDIWDALQREYEGLLEARRSRAAARAAARAARAEAASRAAKRAFDVGVALVLLALLAPVMAALALLVRWRMGAPVLFRHVRPGLHGRPFELLKLRTMRPPADPARPESDEARVTPLGRALRRLSLDELPQLWNVLRGDMSVVGPRPLLQKYLPRYSPEQARRHDVRPGMTGWAQVNGRNAISWDERLARDVWYVDHRSLALDLRILCMTALRVLRPKGIDFPSQAVNNEFMGSANASAAPATATAAPAAAATARRLERSELGRAA